MRNIIESTLLVGVLILLLSLNNSVTSTINKPDLYWYIGDVEKVYDGDTYTINVDLGLKIHHDVTIRAWGINTPEMRGSAEEKRKGTLARDYARQKIMGKTIYLKTKSDNTDKYGRLLAEVFYVSNGRLINLNEELVKKGYASQYMKNGEEFTSK